jgi:hypothetical protein
VNRYSATVVRICAWPILLAALTIRIVGVGVDLHWAYWISTLLVFLFTLVPAALLLWNKNLVPLWMNSMRVYARRTTTTTPWTDLSANQKMFTYLIAMIGVAMGIAILIVSSQRLLLGCAPAGPCPA